MPDYNDPEQHRRYAADMLTHLDDALAVVRWRLEKYRQMVTANVNNSENFPFREVTRSYLEEIGALEAAVTAHTNYGAMLFIAPAVLPPAATPYTAPTFLMLPGQVYRHRTEGYHVIVREVDPWKHRVRTSGTKRTKPLGKIDFDELAAQFELVCMEEDFDADAGRPIADVVPFRTATEPAEFSETDPASWSPALLPPGYRWVEADRETGEEHLFSPDGRNLTRALPGWSDITGEPAPAPTQTMPSVTGPHGQALAVDRNGAYLAAATATLPAFAEPDYNMCRNVHTWGVEFTDELGGTVGPWHQKESADYYAVNAGPEGRPRRVRAEHVDGTVCALIPYGPVFDDRARPVPNGNVENGQGPQW